MDKSHLQYSVRQILIHWIQSTKPLEKIVADIFRDQSLGSFERKQIQDRVFLWARFWSVFSQTMNTLKIDNPQEASALTERIQQVWDWSFEEWLKRHSKMKPEYLNQPFEHIQSAHGVHGDILSQIHKDHLGFFHEFLHESLREAPLAIRCKNLEIAQLLKEKYAHLEFQEGYFSPLTLKTYKRWGAIQCEEYAQGLFEIQDESSQLVSLFCDVKPDMKILDLCSGAGGKTLHLANLVEGKGEIHAWDPSHKKLQELQKRARRWGYNNVQTLQATPAAASQYDLVLVDAPCSSLGTIRRRPQLMRTTTRQDFVRLQGLQSELIFKAHELTKPGGLVVYATCSVMPAENYHQVSQYKVSNYGGNLLDQEKLKQMMASSASKFSYIPDSVFGASSLQLSASNAGFAGDGFFVARMQKEIN